MKVYRVSVAMVRGIQQHVMPSIRGGGDREIADQLHRASRSVALDIADGLGLLPGKRQRNHFQIALGSARESMACIELAVATGLLDENDGDRRGGGRSRRPCLRDALEAHATRGVTSRATVPTGSAPGGTASRGDYFVSP